MRPHHLGLLIAAFIVLPAHGQRPAFEFKGYKPGDAAAPSSFTGSWRCTPMKSKPDTTVCSTTMETIAGINADLVMLTIESDAIKSVSVTFPSRSFNQVAEAIQSKYGPPDATTNRELQNRLGAKFMDIRLRWFSGNSAEGGPYMHIQKYSSDVTHSNLYITNLPKVDDMKKDREQATKKNSQDL